MASEIRANKQTNRVGLGTVTYTDTGIIVSGIVTANSFKGDGSSLTGIDATALKDPAGNVKVQAQASGSVHAGISTFQDIDVGGHTELDNVSIVGNSTITASGSGTGKLRIEGAVQGNKIHLHRASTDSVTIRFQNNFGNIYAGLRNGYNNDQRFAISNSGTLGNNTIFQASQNYNVIVGTAVTFSGTTGDSTFAGIVTAKSFKLANGNDVGTGAGGTWSTYTAGIATSKSVGVNTSTLDDNDLVGVGNSFQGLYISNGMIIHDNTLRGNHYIGTAFNGLMAGPVNIEGTLSVDGSYVVV